MGDLKVVEIIVVFFSFMSSRCSQMTAIYSFFFSWLNPQHVEAPRPGVKPTP